MPMTTPQMFKNIGKPSTEQVKKIRTSVSALIGKTVIVILLLVAGAYLALQIFGFVRQVATNWKEIEFAYSKPAAVKVIRTQYEGKQTALDAQFSAGKETKEEQVLNQVEQALKQNPSK